MIEGVVHCQDPGLMSVASAFEGLVDSYIDCIGYERASVLGGKEDVEPDGSVGLHGFFLFYKVRYTL